MVVNQVDQFPRAPIVRHGVDSSYTQGCRCARCTRAHTAYARAFRARRVALGLTVRGRPRKRSA